MNKKLKIYLNIFLCFMFCMALYLLSTYFKSVAQQLFQEEAKYWIIEIIMVVVISLLNGIILEYFTGKLIEQPERIFDMMSYLIIQLYLFSIILFYIMMTANSVFGRKNIFVNKIMIANFIILFLYIFYLWYNKKSNQQKLDRIDVFKIFIGASLILQSSLIELFFWGCYLLLLHFFKNIQNFNYSKIKIILELLFCIVLLVEIYLLIFGKDVYSKIAISITNIFIIYISKKNFDFWKQEKVY